MTELSEKKPYNIKIDEGLHAQVKSASSVRRVTLEVAFDQALRLWLDSASAPIPGLSARDKSYVDELLWLLREGNADIKSAVTLLLDSQKAIKAKKRA